MEKEKKKKEWKNCRIMHVWFHSRILTKTNNSNDDNNSLAKAVRVWDPGLIKKKE